MNQISMSGDVRGRAALSQLVDPQRNASQARDGFNAAAVGVTAADAVTAAVIRASLEEHLASGSASAAEYWAPTDLQADTTLHNLLGSLPGHCVVRRTAPAPVRDRLAVVPTLVVRDVDDVELATLGIRAIAPYVGLREREAELGASAALAFAANGLQHGATSPCGVVLCAGIDPDTSALTVAAIDMGAGAPLAPAGTEALRTAVETGRKVFGGLTQLPGFAVGKQLTVSMYLATGTEEAFWGGRWRYSVRQYVPGWCSSLTVHRT